MRVQKIISSNTEIWFILVRCQAYKYISDDYLQHTGDETFTLTSYLVTHVIVRLGMPKYQRLGYPCSGSYVFFSLGQRLEDARQAPGPDVFVPELKYVNL